jgi:hypothetical protein
MVEETDRNAHFMGVPFHGVPVGFGISLDSMRCQRVLTASWVHCIDRHGLSKVQNHGKLSLLVKIFPDVGHSDCHGFGLIDK